MTDPAIGLSLAPNAMVKHVPTGIKYIIVGVVNPDQVFARAFGQANGQFNILQITELGSAVEAATRPPAVHLAEIPEEEWSGRVTQRISLALALQQAHQTGDRTLEQVAAEHGVSRITAYRTLWTYDREGPAGFSRRKRADLGIYEIDKQVEAIISYVFERDLLRARDVKPPDDIADDILVHPKTPKLSKSKGRKTTPEKRVTLKNLQQEIDRICKAVGRRSPSLSTLRRRIHDLDRARFTRARSGKRGAQRLEANRGEHEVKRPRDEFQVDHTPLDIIIVHRITRRPIGRAFVTFILDVRTRVVVGWWVTLEKPSSSSITFALVRAMLRKDKLCAKYNLTEPFPVWGTCIILHADNAKEFRGRTLAMFCADYHMKLQWRPVAKPQYGGHIERLIGTFMAGLRGLHGATLSNVQQRKEADYDPEGNALYDFDQLDEIIAGEVELYNNSVHSVLGMTPLQKYKEEIFGQYGIGPANVIQGDDEIKLYIDALPYKPLKVQKEGVTWDNIYYRSDILCPLVRDRKPYIVRRNPHDISQAYFWHPIQKQYYQLSYRDTRHGAATVWELRQANKQLRSEGQEITERALFRQMERKRQKEAEALQKNVAAQHKGQKVAARNDERRHQSQAITAELASPTPLKIQTTDAFDSLDLSAVAPLRNRGTP